MIAFKFHSNHVEEMNVYIRYQRLRRHHCLEGINTAIRSSAYTVKAVGAPELRHFLYKSKTTAQFTCPQFTPPWVMKPLSMQNVVIKQDSVSPRSLCAWDTGLNYILIGEWYELIEPKSLYVLCSYVKIDTYNIAHTIFLQITQSRGDSESEIWRSIKGSCR